MHPVLPVIQKHSISVDLVLQGEVEGEVFDAFVVVDFDSGGVLIGLEVFDDVRKPHREPVVPTHTQSASVVKCVKHHHCHFENGIN